MWMVGWKEQWSLLRPHSCVTQGIRVEVSSTFDNNKNKKNTLTGPCDLSLVPQVMTYLLTSVRGNIQGAGEACESLRGCRMISTYGRNKTIKDILMHTNLNRSTGKEEALRGSEIAFVRLPHIFNPDAKTASVLLSLKYSDIDSKIK